jgi:thiol-disulfide isomerase/thioredoxin
VRICESLVLGAFCAVVLAWAVARAEGPESPVREGPALLDPREHGVGRLVDDVELSGLDGKAVRLSALRGRVVVLCMTSADCPVARKYRPVLEAMQKEYAERGVTFLLVNAASGENRRDLARLGVRSSAEAFVLDTARTLVYRGAVDDQFGLGYSLAKPRREYLREALEAALAGVRPQVEATSAPGCMVETGGEPQDRAAAGAVTYHNRISRIVQQNCVECHREGENGPFPLNTYHHVKGECRDN